jgi:transposase-like protein
LKIKDFSAKSLSGIFDKHISKEAKITTDNWKRYRPISKDYNITQIPSESGANFKALHTMIHQIKTWIRTTYLSVSERNIELYFNEFSYRINQSQSKNTIFNNLIKRMVKPENITHKQILCN